MTKQTQIFMLPEDEEEFSESLQRLRPDLAFVDNSVWRGPEPTLASSIASCSARFAYLWDRSLVSPLPSMPRADGRTQGPVSGVVVQFGRSWIQGDFLLSGSVAAGTGGSDEHLEKAMRGFIADVWKVLTKATANQLMAVEPRSGRVTRERVPEYRAGVHAIQWIAADPKRFFKDRSTENYFKHR